VKNYGSENDFDEAISEINIVPLVDIILVVLIIFMVTAPMIVRNQFPVQLPKASSGEAQQKNQDLALAILKDGSFMIDGKTVTEEQASDLIRLAVAKNPEVSATIAADQNALHGSVIKVLDLVKTLGVKKFGISIDKK